MIQYAPTYTTELSSASDKADGKLGAASYPSLIYAQAEEQKFILQRMLNSADQLSIEKKINNETDHSFIVTSLKRAFFTGFNCRSAIMDVKVLSSDFDHYFQKSKNLLAINSSAAQEYSTVSSQVTEKILSKTDIDDSLDVIMEEFSRILIAGNYKLCDEILRNLRIEQFTAEHLVAVLTITLSFKNHLTERDLFYFQIYSTLCDNLGTSDTIKLLRGLD